MKTILVPLDGSEFAARALPFATTLARAGGGRLVLLRAARARARRGEDPAAARLAASERAARELGGVAEQARADGIAAEPHVSPDDPPAAILHAAARQRADLIVMATHGRGGPGRWLFGSVADAVLRGAETPVLLVPAAEPRAWPAGAALRLLVPLDGSRLAEAALGPAAAFAAAAGVELVLLRVVDPLRYPVYEGPYVRDIRPDVESDLAEARGYLEQIAESLRTTGGRRGDGRTVRAVTAVGRPAAEIVRAAREQGADLIAMATHARGGLARLMMGSVGTRVLQQADVPLLLVRPGSVGRPVASGGPSAVSAAPPPADQPVTLSLTAAEAELVRAGLRSLLGDGEHEEHLAGPLHELLARLDLATDRG